MEETRPGYYAVIPADVRYDDTIPPNAKLLYGEISALSNRDGYCTAGNEYFAALYGMRGETIARLISKLENAGYISREIVRDKSGQIEQRKVYLSVSAPDGQPLDEKINTPLQKNQGGIDKKVKENNTSKNNREKENKKEKDAQPSAKRTPLTDEQLRVLFIDWITETAAPDWNKQDKNGLYFALDGFYSPRAVRKQEPARTEAAFKALSNRLARYSGGDPAIMVDMLERATGAGWKSVFPIGGDRAAASAADPWEGVECL